MKQTIKTEDRVKGNVKIYCKYQVGTEFGAHSGKSNNQNETSEIISVKKIIVSKTDGNIRDSSSSATNVKIDMDSGLFYTLKKYL